MPALVRAGIDALLDAMRDREHEALIALLVHLLVDDAVSQDDFLAGLRKFTDSLEDLRSAFDPTHHLG